MTTARSHAELRSIPDRRSSGLRRRHARRFTDVPGLAEYMDISVRHVRRLVLERRVPHHKVGSLLRFDLAEIDAWLATLHRGPEIARSE